MYTKTHRGFTALISAIIISVILLGLAVALGSSTFFARFNALNREYKRISLGLAESCVHAALGKVASDFDYVVPPGGETIDLDQVYGRDVECTITGPTTAPAEVDGKKVFDISATASYAGAFSSISVSASAQNPEVAPVKPLATCTLTAFPLSVPQGQAVTLQWSLSPNAEWFSIDHNVRNHVNVGALTGSVSVTPTGVGTYSYVGTVFNEDDVPNDCQNEAVVTVTPPPPAPTCADTVMILDRTGSMSGSDLSSERNAAHALVNLYSGAQGSPKIGAGSFGAYPNASLPGGAASVPTNGQLTSVYATITSIISQLTGSTSSVGSNLGRAIEVGENELDSARHDPDKEKVLIFVSDGVPNEPSSGVAGDTGWRSPSLTATPSEWSNATNAFSSNDARATADDDDDDQGYRNFNFTVPSGVTIRGIEVRMEGYSHVGGGSGPVTPLSETFGTGNSTDISGWDENGSDTVLLPAGSGNDSPSPDGGSFARVDDNGGWICRQVNATGVSALSISYRWRGDSDAENFNPPGSDNGPDLGIVEWNANGSDCNAGSGWNTLESHDLSNDASWSSHAEGLPTSLNNDTSWLIRFRNPSGNGSGNPEYLRVDTVTITGTGAPANSSCQLQARIGDAGNFSSFRSVTLSGTEAVLPVLGGTTDDWDNVSWSSADFANGAFRLETRFNDPDTNCADTAVLNMDHLEARVSYTVSVDPAQYARDAATQAEAGGVNIFAIHYGDISGQNLMAQLASDSLITPASISSASRSGSTVTITTTGPHRLTQNQRVVIAGVSGNGFNGTFTISSIVSATSFRYTAGSGSSSGSGGTVSPTNLFIAPSSSAISGIFQSIGYQVCPAAAPACSNTVDDDGDGLIDDADGGCHTDDDESNPSSYDPDDGDEWLALPAPPPPPPPPPPPNIDIGAWIEN